MGGWRCRFNAKLIGLESRQHTGWLEVEGERAIYAPRTEAGFRAPANETLLLLGNGLMVKRGLKKARAAASSANRFALAQSANSASRFSRKAETASGGAWPCRATICWRSS